MIGILGVLATTAIVVINPVELLRQSRDARRLVELNNIELAIEFYKTSGGTSFGNANMVYISLPSVNADSDCSGLSLPSLPTGWVYHCASLTNLQKTDGTGWMPINFSSIGNSLFSVLPIDPVNDAAQGLYYTYVKGSWRLAGVFESQKYGLAGGATNKVSKDGGSDPYAYEIGTDLNIFKQEMLVNADFSAGNLNGWVNGAGGTTGVVASPSHWAGQSAIIQNSNAYCNNYYYQDLPVQQNTVYSLGAWAKTVNEVGGAIVGIANTSWGEWIAAGPVTGTTDWTYLVVSKNSGSNNALRFFLSVQWCGGAPPGSGPSGTTYFAEPSVRAGSALFNR